MLPGKIERVPWKTLWFLFIPNSPKRKNQYWIVYLLVENEEGVDEENDDDIIRQ